MKLIEADYAVEHRDGEMWIEGARLVVDPGVPFGQYRMS